MPEERRYLHPLWSLTLARLREFFREPGVVFWTFGFPMLITVALGIAFRTQGPPRTAVAIVSNGGSPAVAAALKDHPRIAADVVSAEFADRELLTGRVAIVVVPGQEGNPVTYRYDASRPEALATKLFVDDALQRKAGRADALSIREDLVVAPGTRYVDWLVPGLLGMQLMSGSLWGISWVIVQTRQRKLLKRLAATPMRKRHYLASFLIYRLLFLFVEVSLLLTFAKLTFDVSVRGSALAVLVISILGAASFAGLGLLCAARAQNAETANGLINLVSLPMFVVSGVFFSSNRFPELVQPIIRFLPLTALNDGLRQVVNEGAGLASLGAPMLILAGWGLVSFVAALKIFRWV